MAAYGSKNVIREEIVKQIKSNMLLLKFLYYVEVTDDDITSLPNLSPSQIRYVVDTCIYRYQRVDAIKDVDKKCYISMCYGLKQYHASRNTYFNGNAFSIFVMCDREVDFISANGSRIDAIEACIADIFDGGEVGSIGRSYIDFSEPIQNRNNDYVGTHISIAFADKMDGL